ncbi:hypothetical protein AB0A63_19380 [Lentzea sp. NPDC042327]|uniref:hypothetical protein n=1 Tax=Lentzea sp. NPDC042327 TaxID=3154801 RepID=UPI0033CAAEDF
MSDDKSGGPSSSSEPSGSKDSDANESSNGPQPGAEGGQRSDSRQHDQAYLHGRKMTTSGAMNFNREASIDDLHIGDRHTHYYTYTFAGEGGDLRAITVREDELKRVRKRYMPVQDYADLLEGLAQRRLLVLDGEPGTGRSTTALRLLDRLAKGKVSSFGAVADLSKLDESRFEERTGYVLKLASSQAEALNEWQLDHLAEVVVAKSAYLVLVCHRGVHRQQLGEHVLPCPPPDVDGLVLKHLSEELRDGDHDVAQLLQQAYCNAGLRQSLTSNPRPAEAAQIAALLAQMADGRLTLSDVEVGAGKLLRKQVDEWFKELSGPANALPEAIRLTAFRISLAVLNESEYDIVMDAGTTLAAKLLKEMKGEYAVKSEESVFTDDHAVNLPASRATTRDGKYSFGGLWIQTQLVMFRDDRFPVVLLSQLWHQHHKLRKVVLEWLTELSNDDQPMVWVRAAQAMGLFCSLSFGRTFAKQIDPLAGAEGEKGEQRRRFAAIALDQAARDERMSAAVFERVQVWRRHGNEHQQWTAAAALGYDLGLDRIDDALHELRVLGTPAERRTRSQETDSGDLVHVAGESVANLLAFGAVTTVLRQLTEWTRSDRQSIRQLARASLSWLIYLRGYDRGVLLHSAGRDDRLGTADREDWPLLLTLLEQDTARTHEVAELVRWALRSRDPLESVQHRFRRWVFAAEKDESCLRALTAFMPRLVVGRDDFRCLQHLIDRMRRDWSDPIDETTALALENSIHAHSERTAS